MVKSLIALLALSTLCIPQVDAEHFNESHLLDLVQRAGVRVYVNSQLCKDVPVMGAIKGNQLHICAERHKGDIDELRDTIRHEVWHVVQMCNKGPISQLPAIAIAEAVKLGWTGKGYPLEQLHHEAEAAYAAHEFTAEEIGNAVLKACPIN